MIEYAPKIWKRRPVVDSHFLGELDYMQRESITRAWRGYSIDQMEEAFIAGFYFPEDYFSEVK